MTDNDVAYFQPGDIVVLRHVETSVTARMLGIVLGDPALIGGQPLMADGRILSIGARPYRIVEDNAERTVLYQPEGTLMPRWHIEEQRYLDNPERSRGDSLRFLFPDHWFDATLFFETASEPPWFFEALFDQHGLQAGWRKAREKWGSQGPDSKRGTPGRFRGWYLNVQMPPFRRPYGFDIVDLTLDLVVRPDYTWYWKDTDELEATIASGACPTEFAEAIRAAGQAAVLVESRTGPFDDAWRNWRPPSDWAIEAFPDGWQTEPPLVDA